MKLIDVDLLLNAADAEYVFGTTGMRWLKNAPAVDVISKGLYEQIKFERDIAMEQLQENGIAFGAEVQRSRWLFVCEHANRLDYECENCRGHIQTINEPDYILAYKRCPICGAIMG